MQGQKLQIKRNVMKSKILLGVFFLCVGLFSFTTEADAKHKTRRTKKVVYVKKGPNRGRNVIIKKHRRGRTVIIRKNRNGRTKTVVPRRGRRACVRRR